MASFIVELARWYVYAGVVVAAAFLLVGIDRIDTQARGAYAFRPLIAPGVVLLWPFVLWRWIARERGGA
jgi:hypothetical protein